jgi:hypothetical protein
MANHPHTIDRWVDATGENLVEQIARRTPAALHPR